jgi:hypothetical protein
MENRMILNLPYFPQTEFRFSGRKGSKFHNNTSEFTKRIASFMVFCVPKFDKINECRNDVEVKQDK